MITVRGPHCRSETTRSLEDRVVWIDEATDRYWATIVPFMSGWTSQMNV